MERRKRYQCVSINSYDTTKPFKAARVGHGLRPKPHTAPAQASPPSAGHETVLNVHCLSKVFTHQAPPPHYVSPLIML